MDEVAEGLGRLKVGVVLEFWTCTENKPHKIMLTCTEKLERAEKVMVCI